MYRVLLAEDEAVMRTAFRKMMDWGGTDYSLAAAVSNGAEALQYIETNPVDIVVTDLKMPVMDGLELIKALQGSHFRGVTLVMSNYTDFELVRTALTRGAFDYMLKVNLNGETLRKQLDIAAQLLKATGIKETRWAGETSVSPVIRDYFLMSNEKTTTPRDLGELFRRYGTMIPCAVSVSQNSGIGNAQKPPAERALIMLEQIFAEMEAHIAAISETEILLLIPCDRQTDASQRLEDKCRQAIREIHMYLNLNTTILLAPQSRSPDQARRYYMECVKLTGVSDTSAETSVRYLMDVIFTSVPQFKGYKHYKKEVRDALLFIHFHYSEKITLADVAKAVNLNSSYLCRLFKQDTGGPMFQYINELRMQKAAVLIEQGNTYMREVAADVGIEDQFFFTRVFKKYYGIPPSEYGKRKK